MPSERRWRVAVLPNMAKNGQTGALIFRYEFLLQIVSFVTSNVPPYTLPHSLPPAPYRFLRQHHILGHRPANFFCKFFQIAEKTIAKTAHAHVDHLPALVSLSSSLWLK